MPTVLDALCTEAFSGAQILAGWGGLGRQVRATTVCEVPDAADWLRGGEVALSTCHYFHADPEGLCRWIQGLEAGGAAALALKPGRFLGQVPVPVLALADRLAFPLIVLPLAATWPPLIRAISEMMIDEDQPGHAKQHWRDDVRLVLQDGLGLPTLCELTAHHSGCAAVFYDGEGRVLAASLPDRQDDARFKAILEYRLGAAAPVASGATGRSEMRREAWAPQRQPPFLEHVYPVVSDGTLLSVVSLLSPLPQDQAPPDEFMAFLVSVLSLAHHRLAAGLGEERALRRLYLRRLLLAEGDSTAHRRLMSYLASPGGVMVMAVRHLPDAALAEAGQVLQDTFGAVDPMGLVTEVHGRFAALVHAERPGSLRLVSRKLFARVTEELQQCWPQASLVSGVGMLGHGPEGYTRSFDQARQALQVALDEGGDQPAYYEDVGFYGALLGNGDRAQLRQLAQDVLQPLRQRDQEHDSELTESLRAYFAWDCNIERTAKHLFIHPNTLRYRLKQIEELTGLDLNRFEARTKLWLAMKIDRASAS